MGGATKELGQPQGSPKKKKKIKILTQIFFFFFFFLTTDPKHACIFLGYNIEHHGLNQKSCPSF
jgi:hypothetical protein